MFRSVKHRSVDRNAPQVCVTVSGVDVSSTAGLEKLQRSDLLPSEALASLGIMGDKLRVP